jgi:uncharacterized protein DUF2188
MGSLLSLREAKMVTKHAEFIIESREDTGKWAVMRPHAERASTIQDTKRAAIDWAKDRATEGDIKVKGPNGRFQNVKK